MNKFKVGDIIIGNKENSYKRTNHTDKCKVIEVIDSKKILVELIEGYYKGYDYTVSADKFDLVEVKAVLPELARKATHNFIEEKCTIAHDKNMGVTFIHAGDVTIAIPRQENIAVTVKHPDDEASEEIARAVAFYRMTKGVK